MMNKYSKHRPLMDDLEISIARNECSAYDMYQNMMKTCDQDEKEIAELKAENERLKKELKNPPPVCASALLYSDGGTQKVLAALVDVDDCDNSRDLMNKAIKYQENRLGDELDGFSVVAWQVAVKSPL